MKFSFEKSTPDISPERLRSHEELDMLDKLERSLMYDYVVEVLELSPDEDPQPHWIEWSQKHSPQVGEIIDQEIAKNNDLAKDWHDHPDAENSRLKKLIKKEIYRLPEDEKQAA